MSAIQTVYAGIEFRSRLEARWAAFFTGIDWEWTYEPFDGDGYIPDFLIHGDNPLIIEVKPAVTEDNYYQAWKKINTGLNNHWRGGVFVAGVSPLLSSNFRTAAGYASMNPQLPLRDAHWITDGEKIVLWSWGRARDETRSTWPLYVDPDFFDRDRMFHENNFEMLSSRVKVYWAEACNQVKWHGRPT